MATNFNDIRVLYQNLSIGDHTISSVSSASDGPWTVQSFTPTRTLSHVPSTTDLANVLKTVIHDLLIRADK